MTTEHQAATDDNDLNWVYKHMEDLKPYEGKWIAVLGHEVIKASVEGEEVIDYLVDNKISGALLFEMPDDIHRKVYLIG